MPELIEKGGGRKSFAVVVRGHPEDFAWLIEQIKIAGLYIVFSKSSFQKLVITEEAW